MKVSKYGVYSEDVKGYHKRYKEEWKKTTKGLICDIYCSQKSHSMERKYDLPDYTMEQLYVFMTTDVNFKNLFKQWELSNFNKWKRPSIDRLDDYKPYTLCNIRLVTWKENHKKGCVDKINGINNKQNMSVYKYDKSMNLIKEYYSMAEASRDMVGNSRWVTHISEVCRNKRKTANGFKWRYKKFLEQCPYLDNRTVITKECEEQIKSEVK